jgi:methylated-DNA-[protein]-cysteine S-methyltransferase
MVQLYFSRSDYPIGRIWCACRNGKVVKISLPGETDQNFFEWLKKKFPGGEVRAREEGIIVKLFSQLSEYFQGRLLTFDVELEFYGTEFQKRVWTELLSIPYGQVISYGELARRTGNPAGSRAVGSANGANPLPIVVPCHRVIGQSGKLVGYGGGLETKAALLRLEGQRSRVDSLTHSCLSQRYLEFRET